MSNPIGKVFKKLKEKKEIQKTQIAASAIFRDRVVASLLSKGREERDKLTQAIKNKGLLAKDLRDITLEISKSERIFLEWEKKVAKWNDKMTLRDVRGFSLFSKLLIVLREVYADDIAGDILYDDAVKVAIDEVLFFSP